MYTDVDRAACHDMQLLGQLYPLLAGELKFSAVVKNIIKSLISLAICCVLGKCLLVCLKMGFLGVALMFMALAACCN